MSLVEAWQLEDVVALLRRDEDPPHPREGGSLGTMLYRRDLAVPLGDGGVSPRELELLQASRDILWLPLYARLEPPALSTQPRPEAGIREPVGLICVTRDRVLEEFGRRRLTPALRRQVEQILQEETEIFNAYLQGTVYCYQVYKCGELVDECHGYTDPEYCRREMLHRVRHYALSPAEPRELEHRAALRLLGSLRPRRRKASGAGSPADG